MTRDNITAMNKTSKSKPCPSETGNLTELQWVTFLCPHHPTNQTPKSEMKPSQSPFPETGSLTSYPSIPRIHLPSTPEIPLGERGWGEAGKQVHDASDPRLLRKGLPPAARMEAPREWQAQSSRAPDPVPRKKMEAHLLVGALPEVPCHGILLALIQKHQPAKRPAERP